MLGPYVDAYLISWVVFLPLASGLLLLLASALTGFLLRSNGLPPLVWQVGAMASASLTFLVSVLGLWGRAGAANLPLSVFYENLAFFFEKWSDIPALY